MVSRTLVHIQPLVSFEVWQSGGGAGGMVLSSLFIALEKSKGNKWRPSAIGLAGPLFLGGASSLQLNSLLL